MTIWLSAAVGLAVLGVIITATGVMMRRRERMREIAREAETMRVISNDTLRAGWYSAAHRSDADGDAGDGGGGGGDGGGGSD